ncbi:MAG: AmmeMemoRadiSam system protein B [Calditrichaeota bacterium]|nr:AmmeMemoRadiSam system protein B [Calditrichota bacterium]
MAHKLLLFSSALSLILFFAFSCQKQTPKSTAVPAGATIRGLVDTVGFSFTPEQIKSIVQLSEKLEQKQLEQNNQKFASAKWIAGVCPHDDHLLAGRVYVHLFQNLKAKRIVLFGVGHKALKWGARDSLIFDSYDYWRGPFGPVKVSDLRQEIISLLPDTVFTVNNDWQSEEHSVEGIIPFVQYYLPKAEIVSIVVPYMNWDRIQVISNFLSDAFAQIINKHNWKLGEDIAFIFSSDGDHYGDQDWGGRNLAPFGADDDGHKKQNAQDMSLIRENLTGEITAEKLKSFCERVWGDDITEYKIYWCGRFSVPFGLNTVRLLTEKLDKKPLVGYFLRYDDSYHLGKLPLPDIGIGTTAPNNIHHWVGYSAIGYLEKS